MKRKLLWLILVWSTVALGAPLDAGAPLPELKPTRQEAEAASLAGEVLTRYHYKALPLDSAMSAKIFDQYLKALDPERLFFVQADIDQLAAKRAKLGEGILKQDLSAPFAIFNLYRERAAERFGFARSLLKKGFEFDQYESYQYARDKEPWPKTEAEMRELWRKRVKNDWLRLKLAGKDDKSIVEILDRRYGNFLKRMGQVKSADAFQTYMNAYATAIDPHTNYLAPRAAEEFDIAMRLSLVGIGALLAEVEEYATIRELVPGGPAILSGELKPGDRIVGVAQGETGAMIDVFGWRLDDVVALIRGAADTVVVLEILPADAVPDDKHKLVPLVRKTISLEQQAAKAAVHSIVDGKVTRRVGVITLPSFYEDVAARQKGIQDYRSASRDVARLLEGLKKEKVDAVLIDLRNNGGGSLSTAVELTGLFIDKGPVVQHRDAGGQLGVENDPKPGVAWDGPLGVLINRGSASASEIFAGAIQDYGRGVIIGEPSFGKGSVQTVVDLDQLAKSTKPQFGEVKMTVAQFFRVTGGATQLRGVTPDILFPSVADEESFGESSFDNALPWTQIRPVNYVRAGDLKGLLPVLLSLHGARVKADKDFQYLQEDIAEAKLRRKKNQISLNEAERRKELAAEESRRMSRETKDAGGSGAVSEPRAASADDGLQPDERKLAKELAAEKARKDVKDIVLDEAVNILGDDVAVMKTGGGLTAGTQRGPVLPVQ
jgi:carboxyl-terminal processing protease